MKILLVGGAHQGKVDYAARALGCAPQMSLTAEAIDQLHLLVRQLMDQGADPQAEILSALDSRKNWVVLCDEIGCGVVPLDRTDRRWREETGRLCCELARRADRVERITCGLPQRIKG